MFAADDGEVFLSDDNFEANVPVIEDVLVVVVGADDLIVFLRI